MRFQVSAVARELHHPRGENTFIDTGALGVVRQVLLAAIEMADPVFVYNASVERGRLAELPERFPALGPGLEAIDARLVGLMPLVRSCYYHPRQRGSRSLKAVVLAVASVLDYASLDGVGDGGMAPEAYIKAIDAKTSAERRTEIEQELSVYCRGDTEALVGSGPCCRNKSLTFRIDSISSEAAGNDAYTESYWSADARAYSPHDECSGRSLFESGLCDRRS